MSDVLIAAAQELIGQKRYREARAILQVVNTSDAQTLIQEIENLDQSVVFSVDSSLLFQLGEQLVTKPSLALAELVKNAYDADATYVTITMENIGEPGGTILVEDNGHGMTYEEVKNGWMRIATAAKRQYASSRHFCRPLTGAKGVGRFAARRLGSKLTLQTIANTKGGIRESVVLEFDWLTHFQNGENLDEIPVTFTRYEIDDNTATGVKLLIEGLYDAWTENEIDKLRDDLLTLQTPFPKFNRRLQHNENCRADPGFDVRLRLEGKNSYESLSGDLNQEFLNNAWAVLDGVIDSQGKVFYALHICSSNENSGLKDRSNHYEALSGARFRIYYFVYSKEFLRGSAFSLTSLKEKGRTAGGVAVYVDDFRVFPYGEPGDDWLQLDEFANRNIDLARAISLPAEVTELAESSVTGRRPFLLLPKNYQLFGVVSISQMQHPEIQLNVSRQRLIESDAAVKLRQFVQNGIYWMTMKYAAATLPSRTAKSAKRRRNLTQIIQDAKDKFDAISGEKPNNQPTNQTENGGDTNSYAEKMEEVSTALDEAVKQARLEEEERISEMSMLRLLASAGTTVMIMNHQLRHVVSTVLQIGSDLNRMKSRIPEPISASFDDAVARVYEWHEMVDAQVSQLALLVSADRRERRRRHATYEVVEQVIRPMTYYMSTYGVNFANNVPRDLRTPPLYSAELNAVLLNILSNALKAVIERTERKIVIEGERKDETFLLRMKDTGTGVAKDLREKSFEPFVTSSLPNPLLGVGTGLGLTIVRDILDTYQGTARFIDIDPPWRTCIEIAIPDKGAH